jgi:hypothetical protein
MFPSRTSTAASSGDAEKLLCFNRHLIDQALDLLAAHGAARATFEKYTGPHLRHVIEHYEALLLREAGCCVVDYDRRPRDRELERNADLARTRLIALKTRLAECSDAAMEQPLRVHGQLAPSGEFNFATASSLGRELVFVGSHAIHHFALIKIHCEQQGISTVPNFGLAPSTVANLQSISPESPAISSKKEISCATFQSAN